MPKETLSRCDGRGMDVGFGPEVRSCVGLVAGWFGGVVVTLIPPLGLTLFSFLEMGAPRSLLGRPKN